MAGAASSGRVERQGDAWAGALVACSNTCPGRKAAASYGAFGTAVRRTSSLRFPTKLPTSPRRRLEPLHVSPELRVSQGAVAAQVPSAPPWRRGTTGRSDPGDTA